MIRNRQLQIEGLGVFTSFSAASVEITKTSRNGWRDWELKLADKNRSQLGRFLEEGSQAFMTFSTCINLTRIKHAVLAMGVCKKGTLLGF